MGKGHILTPTDAR